MVGKDPENDPKFSFPDNWCLGDLDVEYPEGDDSKDLRNANVTCNTPAGVTAVSYDENPQCNVATCSRLSDKSKILDIHVSNRDNVVIEVSKVYDRNQNKGIMIDIPRTNSTMEPLEGEWLRGDQILSLSHMYAPVISKQKSGHTALVVWFPQTSSLCSLIDLCADHHHHVSSCVHI